MASTHTEKAQQPQSFGVEHFAQTHPALHYSALLAAPPMDSDRIIIHFDADAFYAQVEVLRNPKLERRPLGVTQKFLVVTANYEARARGVTKLMATTEALRRCPDLVTISGEDLTPYRDASKRIFKVLQRFGPAQKLGLDEFFVDVTDEVEKRLAGNTVIHLEFCGHIHTPTAELVQDSRLRPQDLRAASRHGDNKPQIAQFVTQPWRRLQVGSILAQEARLAIKTEAGIRTSAGISFNRTLSKLISGIHKPDDQTILLPEHAADFVSQLPVRALPGVGHKVHAELMQAGVKVVADLRPLCDSELQRICGNATAQYLKLARWGCDSTAVVNQGPPKSITVEDSFRHCHNHPAAFAVLRILAPDLIARLKEDFEEYDGRVPNKLTLKWRFRGEGHRKTSASGQFPLSIFNRQTEQTDDDRAEILVRAAERVLSANLQEPFDLTQLNLGATGFVQRAAAVAGTTSIAAFLKGAKNSKTEKANCNTQREDSRKILDVPLDLTNDTARRQAAQKSEAQRRVGYFQHAEAHMVLSKRDERRLREGVIGELVGNASASGDECGRGQGEFAQGEYEQAGNSRRQTKPLVVKKLAAVMATYRNAEALAIQQLFQTSGELEGLEPGGDGEDKASLELALKLQREEIEASNGNKTKKRPNNKGPLDMFIVKKSK